MKGGVAVGWVIYSLLKDLLAFQKNKQKKSHTLAFLEKYNLSGHPGVVVV